MLSENLKAKLAELDREITRVEARFLPLQQELARLREYRGHVERLLELENGGSLQASNAPGQGAEAAVPRRPGGEPYWKAIADHRGYQVNGDSAHRVVLHLDPTLHARIAHHCIYDNRTYP